MPIFGYSEHDLDEGYERGVRDGRTMCIRELLDALSELFPDLVHITNRNPCFGIPDIIRGLKNICECELSRCSRQQSEIEFLKYIRSKMETEIDALESGKLHTTIENLTVERGQLKQQIAVMQNKLARLQSTHRTEKQKLEDEIEQIDGLVVEYESKMQNAR